MNGVGVQTVHVENFQASSLQLQPFVSLPKEIFGWLESEIDQETKRLAGLTERHTKAGPSYNISPLIYMVTMWRSGLM